jgi:acetyl esterase
LPPVFIATAEFDVLRSEGEALAVQLHARGTHVTHRSARGVNHGYLGALDAVPEARMTITAAAHWIRSRLT